MKNNIAGLAGIIATQAEQHHPIYGHSAVYQSYLDVERDSGVVDRVILLFQEAAIDRKSYQEDVAAPEEHIAGLIQPGQKVIVCGKVQTHKDCKTGRVKVFVWCEYIGLTTEQVVQQNGIKLVGEVAHNPIHRITPYTKKHITEMVIKVPSAFSEGFYSYIPTIAWDSNADTAAEYKEGDTVEITGRLQSREYIKKYEDGSQETLTTYEISAGIIKKTEQKGNGRANGS